MTKTEDFARLFMEMHMNGARRGCASTQHLVESFKVNGCNSLQSMVSAMMTFGGLHAPLTRTAAQVNDIMAMSVDKIPAYVNKMQGRIPGFGSGFVKDEPDPIHQEIDAFILEHCAKHHYHLVEYTEAVQKKTKKKLFPNTALYSGFFANIMNLHPVLVPGLAIEARMIAWNQILRQTLNQIAQ